MVSLPEKTRLSTGGAPPPIERKGGFPLALSRGAAPPPFERQGRFLFALNGGRASLDRKREDAPMFSTKGERKGESPLALNRGAPPPMKRKSVHSLEYPTGEGAHPSLREKDNSLLLLTVGGAPRSLRDPICSQEGSAPTLPLRERSMPLCSQQGEEGMTIHRLIRVHSYIRTYTSMGG